MDRHFLYSDPVTGAYREHNEDTDSLKLLSITLGAAVLTEAKLANLVDGADAADEHIHDARYFRQDQHIDERDAVNGLGLPVITDAISGYLDQSFIDVATLNGALSHSSLQDLGADDHLQYIRVDGTRAFTGDQSMGTNRLTNVGDPTSAQDAATKAYVDAIAVGLRPKGDVVAASTANLDLSSMPATVDGVTLSNGDRFLARVQTDLTENGIYVFNGAASAATRAADQDNAPLSEIVNGVWIPLVLQGTENGGKSYFISSQGTGSNGEHIIGTDDIVWDVFSRPFAEYWELGGQVLANEEAIGSLNDEDVTFIRNNNEYIRLGSTTINTSRNIVVNGGGRVATFDSDFVINALDAEYLTSGSTYSAILRSGNGTGALSSGLTLVRSGNTDAGTSGPAIIRSGDSANGNSGDATLASGSAPNGTRGKVVLNGSFVDASSTQIKNVQDPTDPQDAVTVAYLNTFVQGLNPELTASGAVALGDLVVMAGNDLAETYATLTDDDSVVGIAIEAAANTEAFRFKKTDYILEGVLTGATAGARYYWTGSGLSTTMPTGASENVWQVGTAVNATDLSLDLKFIVKRSA